MNKYGIPVLSKLYKTIGNDIRNPKYMVQTEQQNGLIDRIKFKECDGEYVGGTGRRLRSRMKEHQADVRLEERKEVHDRA